MPAKTKEKKKTTRSKVVRGQKKTQPAKKKWSRHVMETSNALDLERNVFKLRDPKRIARSLKRSAEKSNRRKGTPFQSAMSMLNFYINRAGKNLTAKEKKPLEKAKQELRIVFGRAATGANAKTRKRSDVSRSQSRSADKGPKTQRK